MLTHIGAVAHRIYRASLGVSPIPHVLRLVRVAIGADEQSPATDDEIARARRKRIHLVREEPGESVAQHSN